MKFSVFFVIFLFFIVSPVFSQHNLSTDAEFVTRYMWRGFDVLDNRSAIQPSVTYSHDDGFYLNIWSSFCLYDRDAVKDVDEVDVTISYSRSINEIFAFEAGLVNYLFPAMDGFPDDNSNTQEIYLALSASYFKGDPYLAIYYDFNLGDGLFVQAGYSREVELSDKISTIFNFDLGYIDGSWGLEERGFSNIDTGLTIPLDLENFGLSFGLYSVFILNDQLKDMNRGKSTELWGKVSFSFRF